MTKKKLDNHYAEMKIQPAQYALDKNLDAVQHHTIKYITRWKEKNGTRDLYAAIGMLRQYIVWHETGVWPTQDKLPPL